MIKKGEVLSFSFHGRMMPFEVMNNADGLLRLRSVDLQWESQCTESEWLKQKRILEENGYFQSGNAAQPVIVQ